MRPAITLHCFLTEMVGVSAYFLARAGPPSLSKTKEMHTPTMLTNPPPLRIGFDRDGGGSTCSLMRAVAYTGAPGTLRTPRAWRTWRGVEHVAHVAHVDHVAHLAHQARLARLGP